ncbi:thioredoxin-like protein [Lentithecium fluviatile CBS 122367]|uniref:Thioredoxin-like protein n=1 Tax=Lentithecium fluviatile CBS 122367 TaxID=1168545 RepID=A0A6G1J879_9PLEO|nr:thioredoxin-like protein [Lentithecium fluviatile CBS 122367]
MPYESTITLTLDTICPWTYLAYLRLTKALSSFHSDKVTFTLRFAPYQLYPDFSQEGEDKYAWYKREKYDEDEGRMEKYTRYMQALGRAEGVEFDFGGRIGNTLHAHRILNYIQEEKGAEVAQKSLQLLYKQYFTERAHPSSTETLMKACGAAGLSDTEARRLVDDEYEGLVDVKGRIREQVGDGVDSVPYIVFEGRRRDFTLVGAKEVEEYAKLLGQVEKEV